MWGPAPKARRLHAGGKHDKTDTHAPMETEVGLEIRRRTESHNSEERRRHSGASGQSRMNAKSIEGNAKVIPFETMLKLFRKAVPQPGLGVLGSAVAQIQEHPAEAERRALRHQGFQWVLRTSDSHQNHVQMISSISQSQTEQNRSKRCPNKGRS